MKQFSNKFKQVLLLLLVFPLLNSYSQDKNTMVITNDMNGTIIKPSGDKIDFNLGSFDVGNHIKIESYDQNGNMFYTVLKKTISGIDVGVDKESVIRNQPNGIIQFAKQNKVFKNLQVDEISQQRCGGWLCIAALFCCVEITYTSSTGEIIAVWNCNCTDPM